MAQKPSREMIVDRLVAANINTDNLAIEATGESVRITGSVPTEAERNRLLAVAGDAQAAGLQVMHRVEVRPGDRLAENEEPSADNRFPPEPA
jgi:hypothetical protein